MFMVFSDGAVCGEGFVSCNARVLLLGHPVLCRFGGGLAANHVFTRTVLVTGDVRKRICCCRRALSALNPVQIGVLSVSLGASVWFRRI